MTDDSRISIDKAGVLDVSAHLQTTADRDIPPRTDRIRQQFMWHATFGERTGSPAVQAAATHYYAQMNAALDFLDALAYNVGVLAQATRDAVTAYEQADDLSAQDANAVLRGASTRVSQVEAATAAAHAAYAAQEQRAERDSMNQLRDHKQTGGGA